MGMASLEMPGTLPSVPCQCTGSGYVDDETGCICGNTERVLRAGAGLTAAQREWCLQEIDRVEGHSRKDHEGETDAELGQAVLSAWVDYCRDKGMM